MAVMATVRLPFRRTYSFVSGLLCGIVACTSTLAMYPSAPASRALSASIAAHSAMNLSRLARMRRSRALPSTGGASSSGNDNAPGASANNRGIADTESMPTASVDAEQEVRHVRGAEVDPAADPNLRCVEAFRVWARFAQGHAYAIC